MERAMRYYLVIGKRNGGINKTDNWPWMRTASEARAKKALQYMTIQEPDYEWRITVQNVSARER